jgi:threonine dehydrogenase-like Zn-dependent dehydrogenase
MRALVFTNPGQVELREEPAPTLGADEDLVTVRASGICGSELHGFRSAGFRVPPLIMGHEFVGTTSDGRRVAINPLQACDTCDSCRRGRPQLCRDRSLLGIHRPGGFAEQVAVPRSALHLLPDGLPFAAAALIEPLANAGHAWSMLQEEEPARALVLGAGPIGLLCALFARTRGVEAEITDTSPSRRATAEALSLQVVEEPTGEYDAVLDAVGVAATRQATIHRTRPGGTAIWIGLAHDSAEIPGNTVVRGERTIRGSFAYTPEEFAAAVALAPDLELDWTTQVPLERAADVFYSLADGNTAIAKAVIVPEPA